MWDLRAGLVAFESPCGVEATKFCSLNWTHKAWTCDRLVSAGPAFTLLLLSSDGLVNVVDIRNGFQHQSTLSLNTGRTFSPASQDHMTIRVSVLFYLLFHLTKHG